MNLIHSLQVLGHLLYYKKGTIEGGDPNLITGINSTRKLISSAVFPNPSSGLVTITLPDVASDFLFYLRGASGKLLLSERLSNQSTLDISYLPSGIYWYSLQTESGQNSSGKLVLEYVNCFYDRFLA